jgi:hypothetical protein
LVLGIARRGARQGWLAEIRPAPRRRGARAAGNPVARRQGRLCGAAGCLAAWRAEGVGARAALRRPDHLTRAIRLEADRRRLGKAPNRPGGKFMAAMALDQPERMVRPFAEQAWSCGA